MKLLQLPRCMLGQHHRDRRRAWYDGPVVRSHCIGCGKPMVKDYHGWNLAPTGPVETQAASE